jgi:ferredoxin
MKTKVDSDICIGCGLCVEICPEVYEMEDDLAVAIVDVVPKELESACKEAEEQCPVTAITTEE